MNNNIYDIFETLRFRYENETVEFKKAENNFDFDTLGKYFSALSNEANLHHHEFAWLVCMTKHVKLLEPVIKIVQ